MTLLVVLVTVPSDRAQELAERWVSERLAACANVLDVTSTFWWEGEVTREPEKLVILKVPRDRFDPLRRGIEASHPYDVPEILALPVEKAHAAYAAWVHDEVKGQGS